MEDALHKDKLDITGRQAARMVWDYYKTNKVAREQFNIVHLAKLEYFGDDRMADWLHAWDRILADQDVAPSVQQLNHSFYEKIQRSVALKGDIEYYDRLDEGHPDKTYEYLRKRMWAFIVKHRQDKFLNQIVDAESKATQAKPPKTPKNATPAAAIPSHLKGQCPYWISTGCRNPNLCKKGAHDQKYKGVLLAGKGDGGGGGKGQTSKGAKGDPKDKKGKGKGDKGKGKGNGGGGTGSETEKVKLPCFKCMDKDQVCDGKNPKFRHKGPFTKAEYEKFKEWKKNSAEANVAAPVTSDDGAAKAANKQKKAKAKAKAKAAQAERRAQGENPEH